MDQYPVKLFTNGMEIFFISLSGKKIAAFKETCDVILLIDIKLQRGEMGVLFLTVGT